MSTKALLVAKKAELSALCVEIAALRAQVKSEREVNKQTRAAIKAERAAAKEVKGCEIGGWAPRDASMCGRGSAAYRRSNLASCSTKRSSSGVQYAT